MTPTEHAYYACMIASLLLVNLLFGSELTNVALQKPVQQTGRVIPKGTQFSPYYAVDGGTSTNIAQCTHTKDTPEFQPLWWIVDLQKAYHVHAVVITNRGDGCNCGDRLRDFEIEIYSQNPLLVTSAQRKLCNDHPGPMGEGATVSFTCKDQPIRGRYVRVAKPFETDALVLCEVQVMAPISSSPSALSHVFTANLSRNTPVDVITELTSYSKGRCLAQCSLDPSCTAVSMGPPQVGTAGSTTRQCRLLDYGGFDASGSASVDGEWELYVMVA